MHFSAAALCAALWATVAVAKPTRRAACNSTFSVVDGKPLFTFDYATAYPDDTNWIGLYNTGDGPEDGTYTTPSLVWEYTPGEAGQVLVSADGLAPGSYEAYFLAKDGYRSLAKPLDLIIPLRFIPTTPITLHNARVGDEYRAAVTGLVGSYSGVEVVFSIAESDSWATISEDGVITGTPTAAGETKLTVSAALSSAPEAASELEVTIPVAAAGAPLVSKLTAMSYNLWHQGTQVNGYQAKQISFLSETNVDIVALQESSATRTRALAESLGWYWNAGSGDCGVISRYPITETNPQHGHGMSVSVDLSDVTINVWNVHLHYTPYGPYDFCFDDMSVAQVLEREESSNRGPQIRETISLMSDDLAAADESPVLLLGDFNAPSHLDWVDETASTHCGVGYVEWPTSKVPVNSGMIDGLRTAIPDPLANPEITWSPIFLTNNGRPEPLDRIDFVYHKGSKLTVESAETLVRGDPKPMPNHSNNEWTSDHAAVAVTYTL